MRISFIWATLALFHLTNYSCKTNKDSAVKNLFGQRIGTENRSQWTTADDADAFSIYQTEKANFNRSEPAFAVSARGPLSPQNKENAALMAVMPVAIFLNETMQTMFERIVELHPELNGVVPTPEIDLLISDVVNAASHGTLVCYDVPMLFNESDKKAASFALTSSGSIYAVESDYRCIHKPASAEIVSSIAQGYPPGPKGCKIVTEQRKDGRTWLLPTSGCDYVSEWSKSYSGANKLIQFSTSNRISVESGLIEAWDDPEAVIATIAHELGHYIRAHAVKGRTGPSDEYDYFYDLKSYDHKAKPKPMDNAVFTKKDLQMLRVIADFAKQYRNADPFEGMKVPPYMIKPWLALAMDTSIISRAAGPACIKAGLMPTSLAFKSALGKWPDQNMIDREKGKQVYLEFEQNILNCALTIEIVANGPVKTNQVLAGELVSEFNKSATLKKLGASWISQASKEKSLSAAMTSIEKLTTELQDHRAYDYINRFAENQIGLYTVEQEADDSMVEWLMTMGIDPKAGERVVIALAAGRQKKPGYKLLPGETSTEDCKKHYCSKSGYGSDLVAVGDYSDSHHSGCFRAANIRAEANTLSQLNGLRKSGKVFNVQEFKKNWPVYQQLVKTARLSLLPKSADPRTTIPLTDISCSAG